MGGRAFVLRDSVWTDIGHADRIPVTVVAAYSRAYFDLVRLLPELAPYLSAGENVVVAGRRGSIRIARAGIESWGSGELRGSGPTIQGHMTADLARLFEEYYPSLVRMLYRRTGDRDRAEDLAQETFARAVSAPPDNPRPWLFAVALEPGAGGRTHGR